MRGIVFTAVYADGKITSNLAGKMYVGKGAVAGRRGAIISKDGLRMYLPPVYKVRQGFRQSNFQKRGSAMDSWYNKNKPAYYNTHLQIKSKRKWF